MVRLHSHLGGWLVGRLALPVGRSVGVCVSQLFKADLFISWSIFSRGPKRLTFYLQVLWASEVSFACGLVIGQRLHGPSNWFPSSQHGRI